MPKYQQRTQRESNNPPPRLARATPKIQNLMEMTPLVARTRALFVRAVRKGKRGLLHEECTSLQVIPQSPPLNAKKGCKWGAGQQPTAPKYIPSLTLPKKRDLHGPPENGTAKSHGSKSCGNRSACLGPARCAYRGQRRSRTWQSHRAAPQAPPLVYMAREKDPCQGLR